MIKKLTLLLPLLSLLLIGCGVQRVMGVQGLLTDDNGDPLNGTFSMTFDYCENLSGDCDSKFTQTQAVTVTNGLFDADIGTASTAANADPDPAIFCRATVSANNH